MAAYSADHINIGEEVALEVLLEMQIAKDGPLLEEAFQALEKAGIRTHRSSERLRGPVPYPDIVVALGSAGAFTALYQIVCRLLEKNKGREISIERKGTSISLKGHSMPEELELLRKLAPELVENSESDG